MTEWYGSHPNLRDPVDDGDWDRITAADPTLPEVPDQYGHAERVDQPEPDELG